MPYLESDDEDAESVNVTQKFEVQDDGIIDMHNIKFAYFEMLCIIDMHNIKFA
jgi:hypothetical protein